MNINELKKYFGYMPTFHDDEILKLIMSEDIIEIYIGLINKPENFDYDKLILKCYDVEHFTLENNDTYGSISIIFELLITELDNNLAVEICSSIGMSGSIRCKNIDFTLVNQEEPSL